MVSVTSPDAIELSAEQSAGQSARDIAYVWEHRVRHAMDNAKRCRRLARSIMHDERLFLGLEQLAADYETLAGWLRRH
jgi:hypothetical protein